MRPLLTLLLCLLLAGGAALAHADWRARDTGARGLPRLLVAQSDGLSLGDAVERVRRQYNGRIVSAETRVRGNREVHYIKVLTDDGKVITVQIRGAARRP